MRSGNHDPHRSDDAGDDLYEHGDDYEDFPPAEHPLLELATMGLAAIALFAMAGWGVTALIRWLTP